MEKLPLSIPAHYIDKFILFLLYGVALFYFSLPEIGEPLYKLFLAVSFIAIFWKERRTWKSPLFFLFILSIVAQTASWIYSHLHHPEFAEQSLKLHRLSSIFIFVLVAWTLAQNQKAPWTLFALSFVGILLTYLLQGDGLAELTRNRAYLGFHNPQHAAMLYALYLTCFTALAVRAFKSEHSRISSIFLFMGLTACIYALVITSTRAALLSVLVAFIVAIILILLTNKAPSYKLVIPAILAFTCAFLAIINTDTIKNRLHSEQETFYQIIQGNLDNVPTGSSFGIRFHSWKEALNWIEQSPVVGWGGNGRKLVFDESPDLQNYRPEIFRHLHNSFIDTTVNYGTLGLFSLLGIYGWIMCQTFSAHRNKLIGSDIFILINSVIVAWITLNMFESYIYYTTGKIGFGLLMGGAVSLLPPFRVPHET